MFTSINDRVDADAKINEKSGIHVMITGQGCRQFLYLSQFKRAYNRPLST